MTRPLLHYPRDITPTGLEYVLTCFAVLVAAVVLWPEVMGLATALQDAVTGPLQVVAEAGNP